MRRQIMLLGGFLTLVFLGSWVFMRGNPPLPDQDLIKPQWGQAVKVIYANGIVEATQQAGMAPPVTATILKLLVKEGQKVTKGQQLVQLDTTVEEAKVKAFAAKVSYLRAELQRKETLYQQGYASTQVYQEAQSALRQAEAEWQAQQNMVERLKMKAPMDGVVLRHDVDEGEVAVPEKVLIWVGDPRELRISAEVDEEDIPEIQPGQKVLIKCDAFPGETFESKVETITPQGDTVAKSFRLRLPLPGETKLPPGMTVEVNVLTQHKERTLLIPTSAYYRNKVWLLQQDKIIPRPLKLGIMTREQLEVLEGIDDQTILLLNPSKYQKQLP